MNIKKASGIFTAFLLTTAALINGIFIGRNNIQNSIHGSTEKNEELRIVENSFPDMNTAGSISETNKKLPKHMVTGYWHNFCNGSTNMKLSEVPDYYDMICVAFTGSTLTPGEATFEIDDDLAKAVGGYTKSEFIQDIKDLQSEGQHVIISVGGAEGRINITSDEAADTFAESMTKIIKEYGFEGVDIDLEGTAVSGTAYIASALRKLHNTFGDDFIITMAPETFYIMDKNGSYSKLVMEIKDILTICYPQFYNTGSMNGYKGTVVHPGTADMMTSMSTTLIEDLGLRPDQIGFGVPSMSKAAGSGFYQTSEIEKAVKAFVNGTSSGNFTAPEAYPTFRSMMTWSINWDATQNYSWAMAMSDLMDSLPDGGNNAKPTKSTTTKLTVPTVTATSGDGKITLNWNKIEKAISYEIYELKDNKYYLVAITCDTKYTTAGLKNNKTYKFALKASTKSGTSGFSSTITASPKRI